MLVFMLHYVVRADLKPFSNLQTFLCKPSSRVIPAYPWLFRNSAMVSAKRDSHTIARKVSFFKENSGLQKDTSADEDESDDNDVQITEARHAKSKIVKNPLTNDDPRET